jgi:para-aminobenzoate synthetase component I
MREIDLTADELVAALLALSETVNLCLLDSCGVGYGNSHLLVAGLEPCEVCRIEGLSGDESLAQLERALDAHREHAAFFTLSYPLGLKLENIASRHGEIPGFPDPDIWIAFFDNLIVHDYTSGKTFLAREDAAIEKRLRAASSDIFARSDARSKVTTNFDNASYLSALAECKKHIQAGDTYQINLTRQMRAELAPELTAERIFLDLRRNYPAPFAAFIRRGEDTVVSASPERFIRVETVDGKRVVRTSPIKGTRPRGDTPEEDARLKNELLASEKDHAENVMIVDLLRNDIGRVCKLGSVEVEELCALEKHPTFFNLVSTIRGELSDGASFIDILKAVFPCGSITGAPKIRTMQIIDEIETASRGLSMGAIGYMDLDGTIDMSVAIRTMVVRDGRAVFNVGGGIVIDSNPELEYEETLVKAKALLRSIRAD